MLSIQPLDSADGAASYYLDVVNYYENDSKSIRWLGDGAKILGIHGQSVEKEQMIALLKGQLPNGTQLGRIDKDGIHHRPGFDMTVTAPKSFSILLESGADPRLGEVLDKAAEWFVEEMEQEFAQARQIVNGKIEYIDTKNLVVAAFRQPSSRANDPNSHVHFVVQNMTQCPDGKFRSLASDMDGQKGVVEQIMKHHIYGGLKFRNKLANLTKELGYPIASDGDGLWEIQGVPDDVLTHFSKRRGEITTSMDENGWSGAKAASIAAKKTREDKEIIDFDQWKKDIVSECRERGFDPHQLVEQSFTRNSQLGLVQTIKEKIVELYYGKHAIELNHAREAVNVAIESVSQQRAVFDLRALKQDALKHTIASNSVVDERAIDKAIEENIANQQLYKAINPYTQKPLLTTPWQLTLESESIQRIENGKGAVAAICSKQMVAEFIKAKEEEMQFALSSSQKKAMTGFLTSTDRFMAIQGYAGTGKTTMLRLTRELASKQGYEIRGIAAGSAAANELRTKGGLNASTFARELGWLQKQQQDLSKTIFVIDEASMLSNPQGHKIIKIAEQFNTQLKIIGDRAQLPTPSSGKWFSITQDYGIDTVSMTDNLRQKDPELKESAIHASRGEIYDAVEKLSHVETLDTYLKRVQYISDKWLSLLPNERNNTLCFAPTHRNRQDITLLLRERLETEGVLTGDKHIQPILKERNLTSKQLRYSAYYAKNNVIRFNNAIAKHNIKAGDYLTVEHVTAQHKRSNALSLIRDNGKKITFNLALLPKFRTENKDLERPVEVYRQETLMLMAGDKIQFKRNFEQQGIRNSELARISAITQNGIEIITDEQQSVILKKDAKELKHLDHGYVLTTYAVQGKDKQRGIGLIESSNRFASTIQNYYVETTRGISEMIVVTDNKEHLVKAITTNENNDKYSSIEMVSTDTLRAHESRFQGNKNSIALQNVIEKKLTKEQDWRVLESVVERYVEEKQQGKERNAAKSAFAIVNDPKLYRLAKERLGFKTNSYRQNALTFERAKLFHTLSTSERMLFSTVRQYASLNQQIAMRIAHGQAVVPLTKKTANKKNIVTKGFNLNHAHVQHLTTKRNALAGVISRDLEQFKPYLKHFSIGELNRLGLPQHELGAESKKAAVRIESLARHAACDLIRVNVSAYLSAQGEAREMLASQIKREVKLSHRFVIDSAKTLNQQPDRLWKNIHRDAREHSDRLFRKGLGSEGQLAFDSVKAYKQIQLEIRDNWSDSLKQHEKGSEAVNGITAKSKELLTCRNQLAHQLVQNKALHEVATYFKLDINALKKQNDKHHYRDNVRQFVVSRGNFKEKLAAIHNIKNDIAGHYPFIKEAHVDSKIISKFMRVTDRQARFDTLSSAEKIDYKVLLDYKSTSTKAYKEWQIIHQHNKKDTISKAMGLSARRDYLACKLQKSPFFDALLGYEKSNKEKILTNANTHQMKLRELKDLNEITHTLATQYTLIKSKDSPRETEAWKNNWSEVCKQVKRLEKGPMYQFALKEYPLNSNAIKDINHELHDHFDYKSAPVDDHAIKFISKALKRTQDTSKYLDAKLINEVLMASPEKTYTAIWGEPKSQTSKELRYSGGLIVTLKGKDKGLWHDFSEGVGGAPIQAIMTENNLVFKDAINVAAEMAGIHHDNYLAVTKKLPQLSSQIKSDDHERKNKIASATSIWNGAVDMKGTLAEKYLNKHRGLDNGEHFEARYWPEGASWKNCNERGVLEDKVNKIPALVIAAKNEKGELTGVQRIYLDKHTGAKNTFMENAKLSKGVIEGSCGVIQKGMRGSCLYIAEGPETAASIAMADRKATVLVSFGISNIKNLSSIIKSYKAKEVIIAADNDGELSKTRAVIDKTLEALKQNDVQARAIFPDAIQGKNKTDWNDVLLHRGVTEIQRQLFGKDIATTKSTLEKPMDVPSSIMALASSKSLKFDDIKIQTIRESSMTVSKEQQIHKLVDTYNKNNTTLEKNRSVSIVNPAPVKVHREVDMEL